MLLVCVCLWELRDMYVKTELIWKEKKNAAGKTDEETRLFSSVVDLKQRRVGHCDLWASAGRSQLALVLVIMCKMCEKLL